MTIDKIVEHLKTKYPEQIAAWSSEYNLKCSDIHSNHADYMRGLNDYLKERAGTYFRESGSWKLPTKAEMDEETKQMKRIE